MISREKIFSKYALFSLLAIILLGFGLRLYRLHNVPPGFFADEASIGYNAYTLLNNLSDEEGRKLPILFKNFGDFYRPGVSVYSTAPIVGIFGLDEWSVRFAAVLMGTISIPLLYLLTLFLFSSIEIALISAFFLAISPWHIHMSRIGQEFIYLPTFLLCSLFLFVYGIKKHKDIFLLLSFVFLGLTLYTYVIAYFVVPFTILGLLFLYREELLNNKKVLIGGLILIFLISIPLIEGVGSGKTFSRFSQISRSTVDRSRSEVMTKVTRTYLDHFSPSFLLLDGDTGYPGHFITRYSIKGIGQLYIYQLILVAAGLIFLVRFYSKTSAFIFILLLVYPLGSTFAPFADGGGPFASRSLVGIIPLTIISGLGTYYILSSIKQNYQKVFLTILLATCIAISLYDFLEKYHHEYPVYAADYWGWQYGPRDIVKKFIVYKDNYDALYMEGKFNAPHIHIKFYDPENKCESKCLVGEIDKFDKTKRQLFAFSPETLSGISGNYDFHSKDTINYPNGNPAFYIGEITPKTTGD